MISVLIICLGMEIRAIDITMHAIIIIMVMHSAQFTVCLQLSCSWPTLYPVSRPSIYCTHIILYVLCLSYIDSKGHADWAIEGGPQPHVIRGDCHDQWLPLCLCMYTESPSNHMDIHA